MYEFTAVLGRVLDYAKSLGFTVHDDNTLDKYFKGDMDGKTIVTSSMLDDEQELFNVLHMIGHSIQWNVSEDLRKLGNVLYKNPNETLLRKLQNYEWEANCYGLQVLHNVEVWDMDIWLYDCYQKDMYYLTHYYKTGEKKRQITKTALRWTRIKILVPKVIPSFTPVASEKSRSGIVIDF